MNRAHLNEKSLNPDNYVTNIYTVNCKSTAKGTHIVKLFTHFGRWISKFDWLVYQDENLLS